MRSRLRLMTVPSPTLEWPGDSDNYRLPIVDIAALRVQQPVSATCAPIDTIESAGKAADRSRVTIVSWERSVETVPGTPRVRLAGFCELRGGKSERPRLSARDRQRHNHDGQLPQNGWKNRRQTSVDKESAEEKARLACIVWEAIGVLNVHPYGWLRDFRPYSLPWQQPRTSTYLRPWSRLRLSSSWLSSTTSPTTSESKERFFALSRACVWTSQGFSVLKMPSVSRSGTKSVKRYHGWLLTDGDILLLEAEGAVMNQQEHRRAPEAQLDSEFLDSCDDAEVSLEPHEMRSTAAAAVRRIGSDDWWYGCGGTVGDPAPRSVQSPNVAAGMAGTWGWGT